jgi:CBS domain-containing protein
MPERKIREVIAGKPIVTAAPEISVREAAARMVGAHVGALLILNKHTLVGIFTERDLLSRVVAQGRNPDSTSVSEVMTPSPTTITDDRPLRHALHLMYDGGFRHMPVLHEGSAVGMVSVRDALGPELCALERDLDQREAIAEAL